MHLVPDSCTPLSGLLFRSFFLFFPSRLCVPVFLFSSASFLSRSLSSPPSAHLALFVLRFLCGVALCGFLSSSWIGHYHTILCATCPIPATFRLVASRPTATINQRSSTTGQHRQNEATKRQRVILQDNSAQLRAASGGSLAVTISISVSHEHARVTFCHRMCEGRTDIIASKLASILGKKSLSWTMTLDQALLQLCTVICLQGHSK